MRADNINEISSEFFKKSWESYRKVLESNYMSHVEAYDKLRQILTREQKRPFRFLDLACGDAYYSSRALEGLAVSDYTGVDLSEAALKFAEEELRRLNCSIELKIGDFSNLPNLTDKSFEIIWLGLSLHHLETDKKEVFIKNAYKALSDDGMFLIYEPIFLDGEDRNGYYTRLKSIIGSTWNALSDGEKESVCEHVRESELPETVEDWIELGRKAGFSKAELIYKDPHELYGLFRFKK